MSLTAKNEKTTEVGGVGAVLDLDTFDELVKEGKISPEEAKHHRCGANVNGFRKAVKDGEIKDVVLKGVGDKFNIFADIKVQKGDGTQEYRGHILTTKMGTDRDIVNPQTAFKLLTDLGVEKYRVKIAKWDADSFFNKHKLSVDSRERAQLKRTGMEHRFVFLDYFSKLVKQEHPTYADKVRYLTERAVEAGYVPPRKPPKANSLENWISDGNPPAWVVKAALDVCVEKGFVPNKDDEIEMAAFASLWFDTRGPFYEVDDALNSLPKTKDFPKEEMRMHMKTEVNHYKYVRLAKPKIDAKRK